jgi:hypothetical protein
MLATLAAASLTNHQPCSPGTTAGGLLPSHFVKFRTLPLFSCSNLYSGRDTPCRRTHITRPKRFLSLACICSALIAATDALTIESRAIGDVYSLYEYLSGQDLTGAAQEKLATLACRKRTTPPLYFGTSVFSCNMQTLCGNPNEHVVYYSRNRGAYMVPDPFAERFARSCPEMLTDKALADMSAHSRAMIGMP